MKKDEFIEEPGFEENVNEAEALQYYLDELENLQPSNEIEKHLKDVLGMLYDYIDCGIPVSELVCEANLALVEAVRNCSETENEQSLKAGIEKEVRRAVEALIAETGKIKASDEALSQRVNELSDISVEMVQELGRQPTVQELAARLQIPAEEVDTLIRMSMEAL